MKRKTGKAGRKVHATAPPAEPGPNDSQLAGGELTFPVVGIGASAGGLEAFSNLLKHLPPDTGMAFVFVQHLDPDHASALTEILRRVTTMPVTDIGNGDRVEPNHVHVIRPGTSLAIEGGTLLVAARARERGRHRPIDAFFESLAHDQRERAIGVVLSGTGTDGTLGLEAIKAEGGITFAQDHSARHDSMPQSAIAAGVVDLVHSPAGIGRELARISRHPYGVWRPPAVAPLRDEVHAARDGGAEHDHDDASARRENADAEAYRKILLQLKNHSGVDFTWYRSTTIQRRVSRRTVLTHHETLQEYADFLKRNVQELDALYADVLISVTSFFRNPEVFDALQRDVLPVLIDRREEGPVRCWVPGCSTGQEAYSIVMSFVEAGDRAPRARKLQVFATDLNERLLEKARLGLYPKSIDDDVSQERLRRFFTEEEGGYRVNKSLREMVVFARHNLLSDPPFSRMDLLSCRNLLIYLGPDVQKRALPTFHYSLNPGGFLLMGASESIGAFTDLFNPVDRKHKIYSKRPAPTAPLQLATVAARGVKKQDRTRVAADLNARLPINRAATEPRENVRHDQSAQGEADRISINQFAPPGVLVNDDMNVVQFRGMTDPWLEPPVGKASFDVLKMAREGLTMGLRAAITEARKTGDTVSRENVRFKRDGATRTVTIVVTPLKNQAERHYLVHFEQVAKAGGASRPRAATPLPKGEAQSRIVELEAELAETRQYLQSKQEEHEAFNEELQSANEEAQSANEELQSLNEELETSKEELESTNEELHTVNEEMHSRNVELLRLNSDLVNFQNSIHSAAMLLGRDLSIRRFNVQAQKVLELQAADVGRQLRLVRHNLNREAAATGASEPVDLEAIASTAIASAQEQELEVRRGKDRWYVLRVRPYLLPDYQVDGAVVVLTDIDDLKQAAEKIAEARDYASNIVETVREPLVVLDRSLRVESANRAFYRAFELSEQETVGRYIYELSNRQWDIPRLRQLLEEILPKKTTIEDFRIGHDFTTIGLRVMVVNARQVFDPVRNSSRILLAIEDVTHQETAMEALRRLATLTPSPEETALATELDGVISGWSDAAQRLFGYTAEEVIGKPLSLLVPEERLDEEVEIMAHVRRDEPIELYETARRHKDGTLVNVSLTASPLRDEQGRIVGAAKIAREITVRNRPELAAFQIEFLDGDPSGNSPSSD